MQVSDLAELLGTPVRSIDGTELGRIGTVHVSAGNTQPLLVTFPADSPTPYAVPLFDAALRADGLVLTYEAGKMAEGPTVDADATLSAGEVYAILDYYQPGIPRVRGGIPITDHEDAVARQNPDVREIPAIPSIGDGELPPIVTTRPGFVGPVG